MLWGTQGFVGRGYQPLSVWEEYAIDVRCEALPTGHFLPEEDPDPLPCLPARLPPTFPHVFNETAWLPHPWHPQPGPMWIGVNYEQGEDADTLHAQDQALEAALPSAPPEPQRRSMPRCA